MDFMTGFTQSPTVGVRVWTRNRRFLGVVVCFGENDAWNRIGSCLRRGREVPCRMVLILRPCCVLWLA